MASRPHKRRRTEEKAQNKQGSKESTEERKACSSLFQLSSKICQESINPEHPSRFPTQYGDIYSPWKQNKRSREGYFSSCSKKNKNKESYKANLDCQSTFNRRKTTRLRIPRQTLKSITEPKQKMFSMPKLQKTEPIYHQQEKNKNEESVNDFQNRTYSSQHVLHISRTLKDCTNITNQARQEKSQKIVVCPKLQNLSAFSTICNKQDTGLSNSGKNHDGWSNKVKTLKCVKNKKLKRLFGDPHVLGKYHPERQIAVSPFSLHSSSSNPISRVLFQKYLLVCEQKRFLNDS